MFNKPEPLEDKGEAFHIGDMEAAFYMSRDKIFDVNMNYWRVRFLNFPEYMEYRKQAIELMKKQRNERNE